MTGIQLDFEWRISVVTMLLLPVLVGLGVWQLQRADEKVAVTARWEQRRAQSPVPLESVDMADAGELKYLPVKLSGRFMPGKYFLLDNRVYRGRFGYEVLGVVLLDGDGQTVLVNRGWIAGDSSRRKLPQVPSADGQVHLTGHVYVSPGAPYLLAETALEKGWPKRIQAVEMNKLIPVVDELAGAPLFPYPVRIDSDNDAALTVDWQLVNMSPEKHMAYSAQWFTMAAALFILFILRSSNLWQVLTGSTRTQ